MTIREFVSLAPLTTFKIGGPARFYIETKNIEDVREACTFAHERGLPMFVLGGGSNILIADSGFAGVVVVLKGSSIELKEEGDHTLVIADAGVRFDDLVTYTIQRGLGGLELLSGVPGTVGGAVVANIGAYGAQASDALVHVDVFDPATNAVHTISRDACGFAYHDSIFARTKGCIVIAATFSLTHGGTSALSYRDSHFDLASLASELGHVATLVDIRARILDIREKKGALAIPGRLWNKCAGSFFHMPYVSKEQYENILARAQQIDAQKEKRLRPWAWGEADGSYKLAPGFLLEYTEFHKGYVRGNVGIAQEHILSLVNRGNASAREVATLASDMARAVRDCFAVDLEREVEYVGDVASNV